MRGCPNSLWLVSLREEISYTDEDRGKTIWRHREKIATSIHRLSREQPTLPAPSSCTPSLQNYETMNFCLNHPPSGPLYGSPCRLMQTPKLKISHNNCSQNTETPRNKPKKAAQHYSTCMHVENYKMLKEIKDVPSKRRDIPCSQAEDSTE